MPQVFLPKKLQDVCSLQTGYDYPPSLTEVKQPFARQPEIHKNKKCFSKAACPIKSSSYFLRKAMAGYTIANQQSLHYLTLTVVGWVDVFSRDCYRAILLDSLVYCQKEKGLNVYAYVIMSNHIHLIARTEELGLSDVLRDYKKYTARTILKMIEDKTHPESRREWMLHLFSYFARKNKNNRKYQFWIQNNHPIELSSNQWIRQKLHYVHYNPVRNGLVDKPEHYRYSSASNYLTGEGVFPVTVLYDIWSDGKWE